MSNKEKILDLYYYQHLKQNKIAVVVIELDRGADHRRRDDLRRRVLLFLLRLCPEGQSARRCRA